MGRTDIETFEDARPPRARRLDETLPFASAIEPSGRYARIVKPTLDRVGAAVLLVLLAPVLLALALVVRATVGPGVIERQRRVGRHGARFTVLRFRTIAAPGPDPGVLDLDRPGDHAPTAPTRIGRFLRRTGLDELPQLWNVLRGEMSLVGPRPELPALFPWYPVAARARFAVKPGLTGPWQVRDRGDGPMFRHWRTDVDYAAGLSLRADLAALARTPAAILRGAGR